MDRFPEPGDVVSLLLMFSSDPDKCTCWNTGTKLVIVSEFGMLSHKSLVAGMHRAYEAMDISTCKMGKLYVDTALGTAFSPKGMALIMDNEGEA